MDVTCTAYIKTRLIPAGPWFESKFELNFNSGPRAEAR
jgi:hypothetical protein